jgi:DtxR family Mn-dependent transcriptional regulator
LFYGDDIVMPNPLIALIIGALALFLFSLLLWPNGGLLGYIQRASRLSARVQREDALKHIHKAERHNQLPSIESLAGALQISTSRASSLLEELHAQELVTLQGETFHLTPSGRDYALRILRAHRLWERYLAEETGHDESSWHDLAERLEHQLTHEEAEVLAAQLGNPTHDPHGDPIPTADGEMVPHGGQPLIDMPLDTPLRIVHIEDEPDTVYAQLVAEGLHLGMEVYLSEITPQRIRFWAGSEEHILAPIMAANISVTSIPQDDETGPCLGIPLHTLKPGQLGQVLELSPRLRGAERRRMMDLGILPGTEIKAEMVSPGGDPIAYRVRGALIALRQEQADMICITPQPEVIQQEAIK